MLHTPYIKVFPFFVKERELQVGKMILFFLLTTLYIGFLSGAIITESVVVITQRNASESRKNKLVCQKFTDEPQEPRLFAADHFSLPENISSVINTFQLKFVVIRLRHDADPDSITVVLMYDEPKTQSPGTVFFTKTVRAPGNPPIWRNDTVGETELIELNITQGEVDSQGVVFDIQNTTFLPRGVQQRLWLGIYATGARHFVLLPRSENVFFWCTTDQLAAVGETTPYFFRDESNLMKIPLFVNWTNATVVETLLGLNSGEKHMAWSLTLLSVVPVGILEKLQQLNTRELVLISVSVAVGIFFMCGCVCCICKRCKSPCRNNGTAKYKPVLTGTYETEGSLYASKPSSSKIVDMNINLEPTHHSAQVVDKMSNGKSARPNNPSRTYLESSSRVNVNLDGDRYDKDK